VGVHLRYVFGNETELRCTLRINLFLVTEGHRFESENSFTRLVHRLDVILKTRFRGRRAKLAVGVYLNGKASNCCCRNAGDKSAVLTDVDALDPDGNGVCLCGNTKVANIDIERARG